MNITSPPWRLISWVIVGSLSLYLNGRPCQDNIITGTVLQSSQKTPRKTHDSCPLFQIPYFYMFQSASMIFTNYHSWGSTVSVSHQFLKHFFTNLGSFGTGEVRVQIPADPPLLPLYHHQDLGRMYRNVYKLMCRTLSYKRVLMLLTTSTLKAEKKEKLTPPTRQ